MNDDGTDFVDGSDLLMFIAHVGAFENLPAPGGVDCGMDPSSDAFTCATYAGCAMECDPSACIGTNIDGSVNLPPEGAACEYLSETDVHMIIDGLPPGTEVKVSVLHGGFTSISRNPGGVLGGEIETFDSTIRLQMEGTGSLAGFNRTIDLNAPTEINTGPSFGPTADQFIEAEMRSIQSDPLVGDPDFRSLSVVAGTANALDGPGGTILEQIGSDFDVDSAFSVEYRISFQGAPGSVLEGVGGTTTGNASMGLPVAEPAAVPSVSGWGFAILTGSLAVTIAWVRRIRSQAG